MFPETQHRERACGVKLSVVDLPQLTLRSVPEISGLGVVKIGEGMMFLRRALRIPRVESPVFWSAELQFGAILSLSRVASPEL
jgi:hypothetical protein